MRPHVQGSLDLRHVAGGTGAASSAPTGVPSPSRGPGPTLGQVIRAFKSLSAVRVNRQLDRSGQPLWQRNYYERIVRDGDELQRVRDYVADNPVNWQTDPENPHVITGGRTPDR